MSCYRCERCTHYVPIFMPYIKKWSYQCEIETDSKLSNGCREEYKRKTDEEYEEMLRMLGRKKK